MSKDKAYKTAIPLQYTAEKLPEEKTQLALYHSVGSFTMIKLPTIWQL